VSAARGAGFCGRGDRKAFCVLVLHRLPTCWPIVVTRVEISVGCGRAPWCRPTLARIMSPGWLPNRARWCTQQASIRTYTCWSAACRSWWDLRMRRSDGTVIGGFSDVWQRVMSRMAAVSSLLGASSLVRLCVSEVR